jgi:hypothetical protein
VTNSYLGQLLEEPNGKFGFRQMFMHAPNRFEILKALAEQSMERYRDGVPMQSFAIVGGLSVDLNKGHNLDSVRFCDMFMYLVKSGIPINPDFTVHASNLLYGEDYLQTPQQADITLISYVPLINDQEDRSLNFVNVNRPSSSYARVAREYAQASKKGISGIDALAKINGTQVWLHPAARLFLICLSI